MYLVQRNTGTEEAFMQGMENIPSEVFTVHRTGSEMLVTYCSALSAAINQGMAVTSTAQPFGQTALAPLFGSPKAQVFKPSNLH